MKVLQFYKNILTAAGFVVEDGDLVSYVFGDGETVPCAIDDRRLALPTQANLKRSNSDKLAMFNPIDENMLLGESAVIATFRKSINQRLNQTLMELTSALISLAASPAEHARMSPDQLDYISPLMDIKEETSKRWQKLVLAAMSKQEQTFVHLYVKNKATIRKEAFRRGCIVSFPLYKEIAGKDLTKKDFAIFGVKFGSAKEIKMLHEFLKKTFSWFSNDELDECNRGSISSDAPTLDCILKSFAALAETINSIVRDFTGVIPDIEKHLIDAAWYEQLVNFDQFVKETRMIPSDAANSGTAESTQPAPQQAPQMQAPVMNNGWAPPSIPTFAAPPPLHQSNSNGKVDPLELLARTSQPPLPWGGQQHGQHQPYGYSQQQPQYAPYPNQGYGGGRPVGF
jgi:hypothetical protein